MSMLRASLSCLLLLLAAGAPANAAAAADPDAQMATYRRDCQKLLDGCPQCNHQSGALFTVWQQATRCLATADKASGNNKQWIGAVAKSYQQAKAAWDAAQAAGASPGGKSPARAGGAGGGPTGALADAQSRCTILTLRVGEIDRKLSRQRNLYGTARALVADARSSLAACTSAVAKKDTRGAQTAAAAATLYAGQAWSMAGMEGTAGKFLDDAQGLLDKSKARGTRAENDKKARQKRQADDAMLECKAHYNVCADMVKKILDKTFPVGTAKTITLHFDVSIKLEGPAFIKPGAETEVYVSRPSRGVVTLTVTPTRANSSLGVGAADKNGTLDGVYDSAYTFTLSSTGDASAMLGLLTLVVGRQVLVAAEFDSVVGPFARLVEEHFVTPITDGYLNKIGPPVKVEHRLCAGTSGNFSAADNKLKLSGQWCGSFAADGKNVSLTGKLGGDLELSSDALDNALKASSFLKKLALGSDAKFGGGFSVGGTLTYACPIPRSTSPVAMAIAIAKQCPAVPRTPSSAAMSLAIYGRATKYKLTFAATFENGSPSSLAFANFKTARDWFKQGWSQGAWSIGVSTVGEKDLGVPGVLAKLDAVKKIEKELAPIDPSGSLKVESDPTTVCSGTITLRGREAPQLTGDCFKTAAKALADLKHSASTPRQAKR